jgi:hypothetical protein
VEVAVGGALGGVLVDVAVGAEAVGKVTVGVVTTSTTANSFSLAATSWLCSGKELALLQATNPHVAVITYIKIFLTGVRFIPHSNAVSIHEPL